MSKTVEARLNQMVDHVRWVVFCDGIWHQVGKEPNMAHALTRVMRVLNELSLDASR
jgi:hypothetical protein